MKMREIKFRVWLRPGFKKRMRMFYNHKIESINLSHPKQPSIQLYETFEMYQGSFKGKLMQYTGLKDKNGKDIYEGDILESSVRNSGGFDHVWIKVRAVIEYSAPVFLAKTLWKDTDRGACSIHLESYRTQLPHVEIIGNIWEDPDMVGDAE